MGPVEPYRTNQPSGAVIKSFVSGHMPPSTASVPLRGYVTFIHYLLKDKKRLRLHVIHLIEFIQSNNFHIYSIF